MPWILREKMCPSTKISALCWCNATQLNVLLGSPDRPPPQAPLSMLSLYLSRRLTWPIWDYQGDPSTWTVFPSCFLWFTPLCSSDLSLIIYLSGKLVPVTELMSFVCAPRHSWLTHTFNTHTLLYWPTHLPICPTRLRVPWVHHCVSCISTVSSLKTFDE